MSTTKGHLIIAISGTTGAGKVEVGRHVAATLGCNYLDKGRLMAAADLVRDSQPSTKQVQDAMRAVLRGSGDDHVSGAPHVRREAFHALPVDDLPVQMAPLRASPALGPLVVVGRAARWVLAEEPNLLSVFLHAPLEARTRQVCRAHSIKFEAAGEQVAAYCGERRTNFIKRIAGPLKPDHEDFHLCVDTWRVDLETTVEMIVAAAEDIMSSIPQREMDRGMDELPVEIREPQHTR